MSENIQQKIEQLRKELNEHNDNYYLLDVATISDLEFDLLLKELSKQYILFCLIGFIIAIFPVYYFLNLWLENFAYRITISIVPFIVGFVVLLLLTLLVVLSKAYQATKVDVLKYLKYE